MNAESAVADPAKLETPICLCGSGEVTPALVRSRDEASGEHFTYRQCAHCGIERCSPRPRPQHMGAYYSSDYAAHTVRSGSWSDRIKTLVYRTFWADNSGLGFLRPLLRLALFPIRGRSLLAFAQPAGRKVFEFGAASGNNLAVFRDAGWEVAGCEPSALACASAAKRGIALDVCAAEDAILAPATYSCILINHVLEHVHQPVRVLQKCRAALARDGVLVIALPNHGGWAAQLFGGAWPGYDAPRHLWGFSARTLAAQLSEQGFRVEHIYHEASGRWAWMSSLDGRHSADPVPPWRRRFARPLSLLALPAGALAAAAGRGDFIKIVARLA